MTQAELHELMFSALSTIDSIVQFWISATFAVILVANFAGHQLSKILCAIITFLYLTVARLMFSRLNWTGQMLGEYRDAITEIIPIEIDGVIFLRTIIWVVGTLSAISYLWYCNYKNKGT